MKRVKLTGLTAKIETVYGTDAVPAVATDGIQLEEHLWASIETDFLERNLRENVAGTRMGRQGSAQPSGRFAKITAAVVVKGAGAAYSAALRPELDVLLRASGLAAAVTATAGAEKIAYTPIDDGHESATVYAYAAGQLFKVLGCQGRITGYSAIAARIGVLTFELMGLLAGDPTDVALPSIAYPRRDVKPPVVDAAALTLNGYGAQFASATWEQNLTLTARPRGNAPGGHAGYVITDYDPQLSAQIDAPDLAAFNAWALERAATEFAWSLAVGATQYNRLTLSGSNGQIIKVPQEDKDSLAMLGLKLRCLHGAATPGFTFTFD